MSVDKTNENNTSIIPLKVFLYNKKERFESEKDKDLRVNEVQNLIKSIKNSEPQIFERRRNINGFDFIFADGKVIPLISEVLNSYLLGYYYSTIALCSMIAERLLYDFIDILEIKVGNKLLTIQEKEKLYIICHIVVLLNFFYQLAH